MFIVVSINSKCYVYMRLSIYLEQTHMASQTNYLSSQINTANRADQSFKLMRQGRKVVRIKEPLHSPKTNEIYNDVANAIFHVLGLTV